MRLLVTGFGPFPTMPRNPSAALATAVAASPRWPVRGVAAEARILTTAYAALGSELGPALASRPDAVLMIGVAGRSKRIRVERRATARRSTLFADAAGEAAASPSIRGSPCTRVGPVPPAPALRILRRYGLPSRISRDAGRYLCNAAYFRALEGPAPVLFIHIPKPPRVARLAAAPRRRARQGWNTRLAAALVDIVIMMLRNAQRGRA